MMWTGDDVYRIYIKLDHDLIETFSLSPLCSISILLSLFLSGRCCCWERERVSFQPPFLLSVFASTPPPPRQFHFNHHQSQKISFYTRPFSHTQSPNINFFFVVALKNNNKKKQMVVIKMYLYVCMCDAGSTNSRVCNDKPIGRVCVL